MGICDSQFSSSTTATTDITHNSTTSNSSSSRRQQWKHAAQVEKQLRDARREEASVIKLLLLGAGGGGKSTLLKQLRFLHEPKFTEEEMVMHRNTIWRNLVESMYHILGAMSDKYQMSLSDPALEPCTVLVKKTCEYIVQEYDLELVGNALKLLWADESVRVVAGRGPEFHLFESAALFFDNLDRIINPEYMPTTQDILMNRVCTIGIVRIQLCIKGHVFEVFDVGGQRSERRKWIHCFDNVSSVIFIAAMSDYDLQMHEDEGMNRLKESVVLFESICNSPYFIGTGMLLFLNKKDLFEEKIKHQSIKCCFDCYEGPNTYEDQAKYIAEKYRAQNEDPSKQIICHYLCATDTHQVKQVVGAVVDKIIEHHLATVRV